MSYSISIFLLALVYPTVSSQSPPRIFKQPSTDELLFQVAESSHEIDKPILIDCEAEGEPSPTYRWMKNGKEFDWSGYGDRMFQEAGQGTLIIAHPRDEDQGQYQCFAENQWGIATSNSVFVRKAELKRASVTLAANEGSPFKLTCELPDGWRKQNVYWFIQNTVGTLKSIDDSRKTVDPEGHLWFSNVTLDDRSDDFSYVCAATSLYRNEYKIGNYVLLNVISNNGLTSQNKVEPVSQYLSGKNQTALKSKKLELFCIFGGTPLPDIVWMKNGDRIIASARISFGHYGKSLIIRSVDFEDEGSYTCQASNGVAKVVTHSIDLKVMAAPHFSVEPDIQIAAGGESVEFRCEASGIPEPNIQWIHNGNPIEEAPPNPRRTVSANKIIIRDLTKNDTGNYGCNATNSLGYVYKDVYVNVLAIEPYITQPPTPEATVDGKAVTLTCNVFGVPKPAVKWIKYKQELTGGRYKTLESGNLEITDVNLQDAGQYTCQASNKFGQVQASAYLVVKGRTRIIERPEDSEVAVGNSTIFKCRATADVMLTLYIDWLRNDELIDPEYDPRFIITDDFSLVITNTTELDSGIYTCLAKSELDEDTAQAYLIVQDAPNAPVVTGTQCDAREAKVSWQPMGDNRAPILKYIIQYNTTFTPDSWEISNDYIPPTQWSSRIPISPWTNYTFRVIASNKIGPSVPSPHSAVCSTEPDIPYQNPSHVMGTGTFPGNLVISWTVMPQIEHNGPNFRYRVYYRRDIPDSIWINQDIIDWKVHRLEVKNLPIYARYQIKVVAVNDIGESSGTSHTVIGYSGDDEPTQAPENLSLIWEPTSTTAGLSWTPVSLESVRGEFRGYKLQIWSERDGEGEMKEITVVGGNITQAIVNKFVPYRKNFVRILVYNRLFNGPPSEPISFNTPEDVPGPVASFDAYPMGSSALFLKWTKPAEPNGRLTGYRIYYQVVTRTKIGPLLERHSHVLDPEATSAILANLNENTKYRVQIMPTTGAGEGAGFFIEESTKVSRKPDIPKFTWQTVPKENDHANVRIIRQPERSEYPGSHFFVTYKLINDTNTVEIDPPFQSNELEISGLLVGEVYEITVVAVDGEHRTTSHPQIVAIHGLAVQPKENAAGSYNNYLLS